MAWQEARSATAAEKAQILTALEDALAKNATMPDERASHGRMDTYASAGTTTGQLDDQTFDIRMQTGALVSRGNGDQSNGVYDKNQVNLEVDITADLGDNSRSSDAAYANAIGSEILREVAEQAGLSKAPPPPEADPFDRKAGEFSFSGAGQGQKGQTYLRLNTTLNTHKDDLARVTEAITALKERYVAEAQEAQPAGAAMGATEHIRTQEKSI